MDAHPDGSAPAATNASHRLRALAALSGSLTDALDPGDAAQLVETQALAALGASSAVVVTLGRFPPPPGPATAASDDAASRLHVVQAVGFPGELAAALYEVPLLASVPLAQVAREGAPLFLGDASSFAAFPEWGAAMTRVGTRAAAVVPVWANGELRGVLALTWAEPRAFDEDERAFVLTLGVMCAQAIMRAHLRAAELRAREEAERANVFKSHFLTMISHELRTPMNAVLGYAALLAEEISGPVTALQKDQLGRVRASGEHLLSLVEELLAHARVSAGRDVVRVAPAELGEVVAQSVALVRSLADRKGLALRVDAHPARVALSTDAGKVRQVLVNLLANAVKFTEHGTIRLRTRLEEGPELVVRIEVADTGRGIAAADREHVFEAYWQHEAGAAGAGGGTGLGLSLARALARLLRGDLLLVRSEAGAGSTFRLTFPATYEATP